MSIYKFTVVIFKIIFTPLAIAARADSLNGPSLPSVVLGVKRKK
jgi:hypothetical protein